MVEQLVSIVIPTYRRPTFLGRALRSVIAQTYEAWEALVVDDNDPASPGRLETEAFMAAYASDPRVHYLRHERNAGGAAARNTGILAARGAFVAFLDDDDEWLPEKLTEQLKLFGAGPLVAYSGYRTVDAAGLTLAVKTPRWRGEVLERLLARNDVGTTSTLLCRREDLLEVGLFDTTLPASQDYDLYLRLAQRLPFDYVEAPLVVFHNHDQGRVTGNVAAKERAVEPFAEKYRDLFARHPAAYFAHLMFFARYFVSVGARTAAARALARARRLRPRSPEVLFYSALNALEPATLQSLLKVRRRWRKSS